MPVIDMSTLKPVGEFGSKAWGEGCSEGAIKMLEAANLPNDINWAFTEDYTHPPARLMDGGRTHAGYFIMVKDCVVSAGDGIPDEALALPGFHIQCPGRPSAISLAHIMAVPARNNARQKKLLCSLR